MNSTFKRELIAVLLISSLIGYAVITTAQATLDNINTRAAQIEAAITSAE